MKEQDSKKIRQTEEKIIQLNKQLTEQEHILARLRSYPGYNKPQTNTARTHGFFSRLFFSCLPQKEQTSEHAARSEGIRID